jgi:hypothetical protein
MKQFREAIESVLKAHKLLERFNSGQRFYARFDMPYYSSLIIRRQGEKITVGHYFYLQGDLIGDPLAELHYPTWTPVAIIRYLENVRDELTGPNGELPIERNIPPTATEYLCTWAETIMTEGWAAHSTKTASSWSED